MGQESGRGLPCPSLGFHGNVVKVSAGLSLELQAWRGGKSTFLAQSDCQNSFAHFFRPESPALRPAIDGKPHSDARGYRPARKTVYL